MEEIGAQKNEVDASMAEAATAAAENRNSNSEATANTNHSSKSREEGELSSSDDDEIAAASASQFTDGISVRKGPIQVTSGSQHNQDVQLGKSLSTNNSTSLADRPYRNVVQSNNHKSYEKNRGPFVPFVISFSDDDSGSDSDCREGKRGETKSNTVGGNRSGRPPPANLARSQALQRTNRNKIHVRPKKPLLSHTFVSSMSKRNDVTFRNGEPFLVEQKSRVGNFSALNRKLVGQDHGCSQHLHLNSSKLQDLRQLIAIREHELKRKSAQQKQEQFPGSCRDHDAVNFSNDTVVMHRASSADNVQCEPKEPARKRVKVSEPSSNQLTLDIQQDMSAVQSTVASEKSVLEKNSDQQRADDYDSPEKELPICRTHLSNSRKQKQYEKKGPVSSTDLPRGIDIITDRNQGDGNAKLADPAITLKHNLANSDARTSAEQSTAMKLKHPIRLGSQCMSSFIPIKTSSRHNLPLSGGFHEVLSGDVTHKLPSDDAYDANSLHAPDGNLETSGSTLKKANFWNYLDKVNISEYKNLDMQSLLEIEELQDKELEEAQEHRHKCEIEERNALKAYRKAQRALNEANARCSQLYFKRELFSANFQSRMMEDSCLLWSSRPQNYIGVGLNSSNNMPEIDMHPVPPSSHQKQAEFDVHNQHGHDIQSGSHVLPNLSVQRVDGQNLVSDPCSEPDGSTSVPCKDKAVVNGVNSPSDDLDVSADEDEEAFQLDEISVQTIQNFQGKEEIHEQKEKITTDRLERNYCQERENGMNNEAGGNYLFDASQDSLLLEASLRSQLFARLGMKTLSKKRGRGQSMEPAVGTRAENDDGMEKVDLGNIPISVGERDQCSSLEGNDRTERNNSELPLQINNQCHAEKLSSNCASLLTTNHLGSFSVKDDQSKVSITFSGPILRSTFSHMKVIHPINLDGSQARNQDIHASYFYDKRSSGSRCNETEPILLSSDSLEESSIDKYVGQVGLYTCNFAIDPFWPLCMFELRGKCNNDDCSWQHIRDYSYRNSNDDISDDTCCQDQSSSGRRKNFGSTIHSKCLSGLALAPPTYLVCLDNLKVDLHSYNSILAHGVGQHAQKCFSASLVISNLLLRELLTDGSFLHGTQTRVEVFGGWNRQSSYFHSKKCTVSEHDIKLADNDSFLETALLILIREANKHKGRSEAVKVLARALEADPTSVVLWIVYFLIYYSNQKSVGKDDMFFCAVEYNKGSYELWLMYINSRVHLDDRLAAYERAILALCQHASTYEGDAIYSSECILDLFLQMMHCLYTSGKTDDALRKIYRLLSLVNKSDMPDSLLLSDILTCLTVSDKYIFWICCVYLVVYKKLPDSIVQCFECHKELSQVEWSFTHLTVDEKQQGIRLMGMAVDSLALYIDSESLECEITLKAAHMFALNHISCIAVLEGLECSRGWIDKYIKLYPSCLELTLMSARVWEHDLGDLSFVRFEDALFNWTDDVPGIQCIWNQYAECALQKGKIDFVKELMDRWFHTVWKVKYSQSGTSDKMDDESSLSSLESVLALDTAVWISTSSQMDVLFALINLSLYKLLQNDHIGSQLAIDKALEVASVEGYKHCVREHAIFLLKYVSQFEDDVPFSGILNILGSYLADSRSFPFSEPLSRKFIQSIKKPRLRQLVSDLLVPVSSDFSLVNLILELCYGPSLLPQTSKSLTDLVDFVEAIMEIKPSNYELAFSVCELLSTGFNSEDVSGSVSFWASSLMINALFQAVPVAPEFVWVKTADLVNNLTDSHSLSVSFHNRALMMYPFSTKLWKSYLNLSRTTGNTDSIIEGARERGIEL